VVFFIAFRWITLSMPLIRLFLLGLILLFMPTLNLWPVGFGLRLGGFRLAQSQSASGASNGPGAFIQPVSTSLFLQAGPVPQLVVHPPGEALVVTQPSLRLHAPPLLHAHWTLGIPPLKTTCC